uniref:Protein TIC 214 n=1 Tax=Conocephalum salebrosum TaxID=357981 RepID=A0A8F8X759_9MARC|nr:Ycf1 [Conocephalum salebrosum]QYB18559.1 Ycf1 [Conocephalum salebrosum]
MITSIPLLLSVLWVPISSWINFSSTFFLFGIYYGFLTTLPIGPSQLLSIRAFLLEGNLSGLAAVSGLITGQFLIFLSIYYSPLYIILIKPHLFTLLVLPSILFYWYKIKDLIDYQSLKPITSINDTRISKIFLDNLIFQLINPIVLPSPVLARLLNICLFRYSNNLVFLLSSFLGWCFGQFLFVNLGKFLLFRIESDSPILYLLVKRIIYRTFSIIILSFSLLQLGRAPVPFITKKLHENLQFNLSKPEESFILTKSWPTLFFDYRRWNRPFRYIENSRFSSQSPIKKKVSQYFFNMSLSDGKPRLSFTYLPSLFYFEKNLQKYSMNLTVFSSKKIYEKWLNDKENQKIKIYKELQNKFNLLDNGFFLEEIFEKKKVLSTFEGNIFTKICDPLLIKQCDKTMILSKSPWILTEKSYKLTKTQKILNLSKKNNKIKFWISNQYKKLEKNTLLLPWEPLNQDAKRILSLLINKSKKKKNDTNLKQINFFDENTISLLNKQKISSIENTHKKINRKSNLNWELILNLSPRQKILFFKYLQKDKWKTVKNSWKNFFLGDFIQIKNIPFLLKKIIKMDKNSQFQEINKEIPRWTSKLKNDKFDVIAIGVTDIRQRKVKNLGYLIKGKDKRRKIIRRFSQQSDFRRKLVKGSMRARRRKTLIWKIFQLKISSPFFLRIIEKSIFLKNSFNVKNILNKRSSFLNILEKKKKESLTQKALFIKRTKADRFAIANRWDFPLAQWGRSWLLLIQSHLRKYVILPILIIFKNVIRLFLFQKPEWNQDWYEWNKEIHIRCTYDGTEVSEKELPEQWLRDGLQIKIIYPFYLKPWHNTQNRSNLSNVKKDKLDFVSNERNFLKNLEKNKEYYNQLVKKKKLNYCYLTAWGFQTNLPFGNIKKQPSFWKPIKKKLKTNIFSKPYQSFQNILTKKKLYKISDINHLEKFDIKKNEYINPNLSDLIDLDFQQKKIKITTLNNNNINNDYLLNQNIKNNNSIDSKYKTYIYIKNLENLIKKKYIYIDKHFNKKKTFNFNINLKKKKQKSIKLYKKTVQLIKKLPQKFHIKFQKINMILKIYIKNFFNIFKI